MRTGVLLEIEEVLFDTLPLRTTALQQALDAEGVTLGARSIALAHTGLPAVVALSHLPAITALDETGRDLVLHRATDLGSAAIAQGAATLHTAVAGAIETLASEFPIAVVTRGTRADALQLLEMAGLEVYISTIRSLATMRERDQHEAWASARAALHVDRAVALAPAPLLAGARAAGLQVIRAGGTHGGTPVPPATTVAAMDPAQVISLF
ncbi:MAG: hypothetical protein IT355_12560 [Gemmatimonadaceae bacterium]|nr:hypothetical protein [Gemmatimonadaceae bacterium]